MKKSTALALSVLLSTSCVPVQAIEIKEVNKTVLSTLKIIFGAVIASKGLGCLVSIPTTARSGQKNGDSFFKSKLFLFGYGAFGVGLTGAGFTLMQSGYKGLSEEEKPIQAQ